MYRQRKYYKKSTRNIQAKKAKTIAQIRMYGQVSREMYVEAGKYRQNLLK